MTKKKRYSTLLNRDYEALRRRYSKTFNIRMTEFDLLVMREVRPKFERELREREEINKKINSRKKKGDEYSFF